jgi:hypothetical protein
MVGDGINAHTKHVHVSVVGSEAFYDDTEPWAIDRVARVTQPPDGIASGRCLNITATVFGGAADRNISAYDQHVITDQECGVALPYRFRNEHRPRVRVTNALTGSFIDCDIVDVGPWNTNDPYWETGARPQAESGIDLSGRTTNYAGIDLTPAAAHAIGIAGKGKVNWQFLEGGIIALPVAKQDSDELIATIKQLTDQLRKNAGITPSTTAKDLTAILPQVQNILKTINVTQQTTASVPSQQQQAAQLKNIFDLINGILNPGGQWQTLGQVNGALGQTIGNLLNGKKTAIGTIGALLTALLGNVPAGTGVADVLAKITPIAGAAGFSGYAMPIFLALTVWGALGKFEKWAQGKSPPTSLK